MSQHGFILRGNFLWSAGPKELNMCPGAYAVCDEKGLCAGVFQKLPEQYRGFPVRDLGDGLVIPGYCDLHFHASQYVNIGLGMDLTLLDWLEQITYPQEARFREEEYARAVYGRLAGELRRGFTTRVSAFASAHRVGTEVLMELLDEAGLAGFAGKVNMDRSAPDYLRERDWKQSVAETEKWLTETEGRFKNIRPILTPRFVPSCTTELLTALGDLRRKYGLPVQSHLGETPEEIAWVRELCPESGSYAGVYEKAGLLGEDVLMAHCIYLTEEECALMKDTGSWAVHCPCSNSNVRSGIAPIRKYLDMGLNIGLGSDISGGHSLDMADTLREALSVSRLLWRLGEENYAHLSAGEAFYLATAGGGAYFGKVGRFEPGYAFDAVAVDDSAWREPEDDLFARFQKMIYRASARNVTAKYVAGEKLF